MSIKPSSDRKVRLRKSQKNSFGLLPGRAHTCPFSTVGKGGCEYVAPGRRLPVCYVFRLMTAFKGARETLEHNTRLMRSASVEDMERILSEEFDRFAAAEQKKSNDDMNYRIHWSGDLFSNDYTTALIRVIRKYPAIRFWTYTRSFEWGVRIARSASNVVMYLSLDPDNAFEGLKVYFRNKDKVKGSLRIGYMSDENDWSDRYRKLLDADKRVTRWWPRKPPALAQCPVDSGVMPLEGACHKCRLCINHRKTGNNIWFKC